MAYIPEPEIDPLDDTSPSIAMPPVQWDDRFESPSTQLPMWRRAMGWLSLLGAAGFTAATILLLVLPNNTVSTDADTVVDAPTQNPATSTPLPAVTDIPPTEIITDNTDPAETAAQALPALSQEQVSVLLLTPVEPVVSNVAAGVNGILYNPFTIAGSQSRSGMTQYTAVRGDTIDLIAERFGLQRESIAWCNSTRIAQVLYPDDVVNIPPVDGACHLVLGSRAQSFSEILADYQVNDPFSVIDSPYISLGDISPETVLPSGTRLFIPNGIGPTITWEVAVEEDASGNVVAFAPGQAGSCGSVGGGGGSFWGNPLPNGRWVRGYYAGHSGIDLSAAEGTPVLAANSGPVLYSGWNTWGYGNTVVVGHGPFSTLYGHMSGTAVRCGDFVQTGQVVGFVGSTGNSSGPHLHFEIRTGNVPQDPSGTPGIGW